LARHRPCAAIACRPAALKEQKAPLTKQEVDRIKVILVLGLFTIIFWAGFEQAGGLMNLYAQEYTDRMIGSFEVPTAWFQSLNPFFIITLAPVVAAIWIKLGKKGRTPREIRHGPAVLWPSASCS
jgi:dipeptide/tripeptide permease